MQAQNQIKKQPTVSDLIKKIYENEGANKIIGNIMLWSLTTEQLQNLNKLVRKELSLRGISA